MAGIDRDAALRIYEVLVYLVHSEEEVDPREGEVLDAFRSAHGIAADVAADVRARPRQTDRLRMTRSEDERRLLIEAMIDVVAADGTLDHEEQRRLTRLVEFLGLPKQELADKLLERLTGG